MFLRSNCNTAAFLSFPPVLYPISLYTRYRGIRRRIKSPSIISPLGTMACVTLCRLLHCYLWCMTLTLHGHTTPYHTNNLEYRLNPWYHTKLRRILGRWSDHYTALSEFSILNSSTKCMPSSATPVSYTLWTHHSQHLFRTQNMNPV